MLFKSLKVTTDFKLEIKQYLLRYKTQLTKCKKMNQKSYWMFGTEEK